MAQILLVSTGGTISMTPQSTGGVTPTLTGEDLIKTVPSLSVVCKLEVNSYSTKPGASLKMVDLLRIAEIVDSALDAGATGAVIVQGTDTIEETSYLFDLTVRSSKPVVVMGAMRNPSLPGADGPANLLAAAKVASSPLSVGRGAMVVLNDEINAARRVHKSDTASVASFVSPGWGPLGRVVEGNVIFSSPPSRTKPIGSYTAPTEKWPVAIIKAGLDDDGRLLKELPRLGYKGVIIEAMGGGHLPSFYSEIVSEVLAAMPVVLATRVTSGPVFTRSYSFPGSEMDLLGRGAWTAGFLRSPQARILLTLLLANGLQGDELKSEFLSRAGEP